MLTDFSDEVLLVGIKYSKKSKKHECVIERSEDDKSTQKNKKSTQKKLNSTQKRVINYLKEHPEATLEKVAEELKDLTVDGVKYSVKVLRKSGVLYRDGGRKEGKWVVEDEI